MASLLAPRTMIIGSLAMCTLSAILLALIGGINKYGFFVGVALLGIYNYLSHSIKDSFPRIIRLKTIRWPGLNKTYINIFIVLFLENCL